MYNGLNSSWYNIHCILLAYENLSSNFTSWQSLTWQSLTILMSTFYTQTLFLIAVLQVLDKFVAPILFFPHRFYVKIAVSKNDINCCWNKYRCQQQNLLLWLDSKYTGYTFHLSSTYREYWNFISNFYPSLQEVILFNEIATE